MGAKLLIERASWTLVDQGVVSSGNFLLNVLLARTLSEEDYGEFALFLGAIFILRTIDYSLISYPLSVRLCVASDEERAGLLGNTSLLLGRFADVVLHSGKWNSTPRRTIAAALRRSGDVSIGVSGIVRSRPRPAQSLRDRRSMPVFQKYNDFCELST